MNFWESVIPPTITMSVLFILVALGIFLILGYNKPTYLTRDEIAKALGIFLILICIAFFFASFGYGVGQGEAGK